MLRRLLLVSGLLVWAGALYGVLSLAFVEVEITHDFCGPWGCYPPLQALAAYHGFWVVLMAPPVAWLVHQWPGGRLRLAGLMLSVGSLLGLAMLIGKDQIYSPLPPEYAVRYLHYRIIYIVVTSADLPLLQLLVVGLVCWIGGRWKSRTVRGDAAPVGSETNVVEDAVH